MEDIYVGFWGGGGILGVKESGLCHVIGPLSKAKNNLFGDEGIKTMSNETSLPLSNNGAPLIFTALHHVLGIVLRALHVLTSPTL